MYVMLSTRPDISHVVGVVSRYMANPRKEDWAVVKWVLQYLRGKSNYCITFDGCSDEVCGYVDYDFVGDLDKRPGPLQVMSLLLQVELLVGCQSFRILFLYPLQKKNI